MKILFTGASSFTGMWFVKELANAGHTITAPIRQPLEAYSGIRRERIEQLKGAAKCHFNCTFGSDAFVELIQSQSWDLLCHHAADVSDYKSPNFDVAKALSNNTRNITQILPRLKSNGCNHLLLTGSVFEPGEGKGSDNLRAVSPYGLSKGLTSETFRYYCQQYGISLGKFVIPNPFGPFEEARFTHYLLDCWFHKKDAIVNSPDYIRDNIPVSLLAKAYRDFAEKFVQQNESYSSLNPSWHPTSQGEFSQKFAIEMEKRLGLKCPLILHEQTEFPEPRERVNSDRIDVEKLKWDEGQAWDGIAEYYRGVFG